MDPSSANRNPRRRWFTTGRSRVAVAGILVALFALATVTKTTKDAKPVDEMNSVELSGALFAGKLSEEYGAAATLLPTIRLTIDRAVYPPAEDLSNTVAQPIGFIGGMLGSAKLCSATRDPKINADLITGLRRYHPRCPDGYDPGWKHQPPPPDRRQAIADEKIGQLIAGLEDAFRGRDPVVVEAAMQLGRLRGIADDARYRAKFFCRIADRDRGDDAVSDHRMMEKVADAYETWLRSEWRRREPGRRWHRVAELDADDIFDDPKVIELCHAIEREDAAAIEAAVIAGADVNAWGRHGMNPLVWAMPDRATPRVLQLLRLGADPSLPVDRKWLMSQPALIGGFEYDRPLKDRGRFDSALQSIYADSPETITALEISARLFRSNLEEFLAALPVDYRLPEAQREPPSRNLSDYKSRDGYADALRRIGLSWNEPSRPSHRRESIAKPAVVIGEDEWSLCRYNTPQLPYMAEGPRSRVAVLFTGPDGTDRNWHPAPLKTSHGPKRWPKKRRITGRVVDRSAMEPVADAAVVVGPIGSYRELGGFWPDDVDPPRRVVFGPVSPKAGYLFETRTDADGRYDLCVSGWVEGMSVTARGYRRAKRNYPLVDREQTIELRPGVVVAGGVTDEKGFSMSGVQVYAFGHSYGREHAIEMTVTDAAGRFELFDMPPAGPTDKPRSWHAIEFRADGYRTAFVGPWREVAPESCDDLRVTLHRGTDPRHLRRHQRYRWPDRPAVP